MTNHPTGLYPVVQPRPRGTVYEVGQTVRLTIPGAFTRFAPFTDDDAARAVGVRPYLPVLADSVTTMTLPRLTAADIQTRTARPEPTTYSSPLPQRGPRRFKVLPYKGSRRRPIERPSRDLVRALIVATAVVAIVALTGVLG